MTEQPKKRGRTVEDQIRALKLRAAKRMDNQVRELRARAILIEAESNRLKSEAGVGA